MENWITGDADNQKRKTRLKIDGLLKYSVTLYLFMEMGNVVRSYKFHILDRNGEKRGSLALENIMDYKLLVRYEFYVSSRTSVFKKRN